MTQTFKFAAVVAAALLASTGANAQLRDFNFGSDGSLGTSGASSIAFIALDTQGTPTSLFVDLGYRLTDFVPGSTLESQKVVWDFKNNSLSVGGNAQSGSYNWNSAFSKFMENSQAAQTTYGVVAGGASGYPTYYLSTGTPASTLITNQLSSGNIGNMLLVNQLFSSNKGASVSLNTANSFGANTFGPGASSAGYVGADDNFGAQGKWQGNLTWNALAPQGTSTDFYYLNESDANGDPFISKLQGAFTYDAGVLTWQTSVTAVPEPSAFMMAIAGLAVLGFAGRRSRPQE